MPFEKSAGAIIYRKTNKKVFYLLLHYPASAKASKDYWDLPKGHMEKGEKEEDTVKREVREETGIKKLDFEKGFKEWIKYFFKFKGKTVFKVVSYWLAKTKTKRIKISGEHIGYAWRPYEKAIKQLTYQNAREILKKAHKFIVKHEA